jgi:hypothetical protein
MRSGQARLSREGLERGMIEPTRALPWNPEFFGRDEAGSVAR